MNTTQSARLVLRTSELLIKGLDGESNTNFSEYQFNNISLRNLLGDMYDKYDTFNLCLKDIYSSEADPLLGETSNDVHLSIKMSGLPFINQTYNLSNKINSIYTTLTCVEFIRTYALKNQYNNYSQTFGKNQETVSLKFSYHKIYNDIPVISSVPYPQMIYIFDIYGVGEPKDVNKIMSQRFL